MFVAVSVVAAVILLDGLTFTQLECFCIAFTQLCFLLQRTYLGLPSGADNTYVNAGESGLCQS
jgi:hypothetical protein